MPVGDGGDGGFRAVEIPDLRLCRTLFYWSNALLWGILAHVSMRNYYRKETTMNPSFIRPLALFLTLLALAGCKQDLPWHETTLDGALPTLSFQMTRVNDGQQVTGKDYLGKVVILAFGYTNCPDVCPTTLANLSTAMDDLGDAAKNVRVLFVTVDPNRDTEDSLKQFVGDFAPQINGLRGDNAALWALAKRYRMLYSVIPASGGRPYEVTHGAAVYVFDKTGKSRLLVTSLFTAKPDLKGLEADLRRLLDEGDSGGFWSRLSHLFG